MKARGQAAHRDAADADRGDSDRGGLGHGTRASCPTTTCSRCSPGKSRKRGEAAQIYVTNGRGELAANERAEASVIDEYLPTQLNDDEVANVVNTAIAQVAEEIGERPGMKQMGQVMKAATAIADGKADGSRLSAAVKDRL